MSVDDDVQQLAEFVRVQTGDVDGPDPHLWRLLATGEPVAVDRLAAAVGWTTERVRHHYAADPDTVWGPAGTDPSFGAHPAPHTAFSDHRRHDRVRLVRHRRALRPDSHGQARRACPATGRPIRAEIAPAVMLRLDLPEAVVTAVRPTDKVATVWVEVCSLGNSDRLGGDLGRLLARAGHEVPAA